MKGFIEVHYNENPILINIDNISAVKAGKEYCGRRDCVLCMVRSIPWAQVMSSSFNPDESYDEVMRMIEEAMK